MAVTEDCLLVLSFTYGAVSTAEVIQCHICSGLNLFQLNFSATHILPSSYLFWAGKRLVNYL
jgi:hypothetical protein